MSFLQGMLGFVTDDEIAMLQSMVKHQIGNVLFFIILNLAFMEKANLNIQSVRVVHYLVLTSIVLWWMWLDYQHPNVDVMLLAIRGHIGGLTIALVDFMLSKTGFLMIPGILFGNIMWMLTYGFTLHVAVANFTSFSTRGLPVADSISELALLYISTYAVILFSGLSSDLFFSPVHRLLHSPKLIKYHNEHHRATELCGPILYKGTALDDFIMSTCAAAGHCLLIVVLLRLGLGSLYFSIIPSFVAMMLPYSHASDMGLVNLFFTIPGRLNYIAYHRLHHIDPSLNPGLTAIGDKIWDTILRTKTVSVPFQGTVEQREMQPREVSSPLFKEKQQKGVDNCKTLNGGGGKKRKGKVGFGK